MSGVGDGFAWPFEDPDWLGKRVVQGLIALIPFGPIETRHPARQPGAALTPQRWT